MTTTIQTPVARADAAWRDMNTKAWYVAHALRTANIDLPRFVQEELDAFIAAADNFATATVEALSPKEVAA